VRGGSLPFAIWGTLNFILLAINWIWEGTGIHVAEFGFAVLVIYLGGVLLLLLGGRHAVRRGPPEYVPEPEPLPAMSAAAAGVGIAVGLALFGLVFGKFLIILGVIVLVLSLGRLVVELRFERRTLESVREERRR